MPRIVLLVLFACALPCVAQTVPVDSTAFGRCGAGQASLAVRSGTVATTLENTGHLHWWGNLVIPAGSGIEAGGEATFAVAGTVNGDTLAAVTRNRSTEFFPGPLAYGVTPPEDCGRFDRIWYVTRADEGVNPESRTEDVEEWPVGLGAPYVEKNGRVGYQPADGDYPAVRGDWQAWWILNDAGNVHPRTESPRPLGVEVRMTAYGFDVPGVLGNALFYRFQVRNKNTSPIADAYFGIRTASDLGNFTDDYAGTDTSLGLKFYYNADDDDEGGYGPAPPATGWFFLEAQGLDRDGTCSEGESDWMPTSTMERFGGGGVRSRAYGVRGVYRAMTARFELGQPLLEGGVGYPGGLGGNPDRPIRYMYPGDPVTGAYWSEGNTRLPHGKINHPGSRGMWMSRGPFCLPPLGEAEFTVGLVWSRGSSNLDSVRKLREDVAFIRSNAGTILTPRNLQGEVPVEPETGGVFTVYPTPARGLANVAADVAEGSRVSLEVVDLLGRVMFELEEQESLTGRVRFTLDTSRWVSGLYLVRLTERGRVHTRSLVVR
ncbi:MAG: T9SS type A sorting domain-containing protein [Rhodothermales bacterium]|nr:T9SS type A sorting domain-containing protein [Rhodothermales bacterium]MBO6779206.1 T9SS type A sorting domain-containing protein [Rhodothermales bacterium]